MTVTGYIYYWYKGRSMGMPVAIVTVVGLLASAFCYMTTPMLYNIHKTLAIPLWAAFSYCSLAMLCGVAVAIITKLGETRGWVPVWKPLTE